MKDAKQQTLKVNGWKVGDSAEFLGMSENEKQASRLIHEYGCKGALQACEKNIKNSKSEAQELFWERVAELIEEACVRTEKA